MKLIKLTKNQFAIVDDEDFEYLNQWKWLSSRGYARRSVHIKMDGKKQICRHIHMHRLIVNAPEGKEVDHIDGNPLNNQKSNLRVCTREENGKNRRLNKNNTSGFKGAIWVDTPGNQKKWKSQIVVNKKAICLGYFSTNEEAGNAYLNASKKYFGEFAREAR